MKPSSYLLVLASVVLAGCSSEVAEPGGANKPAPAPGGGDIAIVQPGATVRGDQNADLGRVFGEPKTSSPEVFVCRKDAFCDDFERADASKWTEVVETDGTVGRTTSSASVGKGALALTTKRGGGEAFLFLEKGFVKDTWNGSLSFAMRVASVPSESLSGPELLVKTMDDGVVSLAIVLKPEGFYLEQRSTDACRKDHCVRRSTFLEPATMGTWHRIELGVEMGPSGTGAPYGRVEARIDGGELRPTDLTIPLGGGTTFLRAGITKGDVRESFVDLDDVSLFTR